MTSNKKTDVPLAATKISKNMNQTRFDKLFQLKKSLLMFISSLNGLEVAYRALRTNHIVTSCSTIKFLSRPVLSFLYFYVEFRMLYQEFPFKMCEPARRSARFVTLNSFKILSRCSKKFCKFARKKKTTAEPVGFG